MNTSQPDDGDVLAMIENFFRCGEISYRSWTLESERTLRVVEAADAPWEGHTANISFDGVKVVWPKGVEEGLRLLPVVPVLDGSSEDEHDGSFHAAHLLDWALQKGVPPCPGEVIATLGHSEALPHLRFDHPFPWEQERPAQLRVDDITITPVLAYSISEAEMKLQLDDGAGVLTRLLQERQVPLFDRRRACVLGG